MIRSFKKLMYVRSVSTNRMGGKNLESRRSKCKMDRNTLQQIYPSLRIQNV